MLTFGDKSIEVIVLQDWLKSQGFLKGNEGYYGVLTVQAVKDLQTFLGLEPTGIYDEQLKVIYKLKSSSIGLYTPDISTTVTENMSSQAIFNESVITTKQEVPCYLVNLLTNDLNESGVVFFPHIPEEFSYSKGNIFEEQATRGRSEPFQGYTGSTALTTQINVAISADYSPNKDIDKVLAKLEAFAYPRYGNIVKPPKCFFRCGTFTLEGVLTDMSISRKLPIINGKYSQADVSFSLTETNASSISAKTVQDGKYRAFRG